MIPLCRYILQDDKQCEQAAVKGGHYCRHHHIVPKRIAEAEAEAEAACEPLPFVFPADHASQLFNYFLLLQALNEGRMNIKTVNMMIRLLKACDANLKKAALPESGSAEVPGTSEQTSAQESSATEHDAETDGEMVSVAAAGDIKRARNERTTGPVPQKRDPLDLLRHSRGGTGRAWRRAR